MSNAVNIGAAIAKVVISHCRREQVSVQLEIISPRFQAGLRDIPSVNPEVAQKMLFRSINIALLLSSALLLTACNVVLSSDKGNVVASQMLKCLKLPANPPAKFEMLALVTLKDGKTGLVSINFKTPPTPWDQVAAPAVANAISECEPYGDISGQVNFSVTPELVNSSLKK
ncbi:hypothetical protein CCGE531_12155 [Rhizobium sp. CCGE531]|nr:hypothetical protein CCGE531_12155 [Rhizobium sp. CCGE531]AYG73044.1 hypothetical protein CCGE532_11580 [Rhizobium sp. CCGE532]